MTANLSRGTHERTDERAEELACGVGPSDTKHTEETMRRVDVRREEEVVDRRSGLGKKTD